MTSIPRALLLAIGAVVLCGAAALPGDTPPTNDLPNPYKTHRAVGQAPGRAEVGRV